MSLSIDKLCKFISHGVYVIAVQDSERESAFTAAWMMQVSFDPVLLAFSINPKNRSYQLLKSSGLCTVNVLAQNQLSVAEHFGRSDIVDKMSGFEWQAAKSGVPVLSQSLVFFDCQVSQIMSAGDHEIIVCKVADAGFLNAGIPMLYQQTGAMDGASQFYSETRKD